jgi:polar amino acid transport system substrate-binding protein
LVRESKLIVFPLAVAIVLLVTLAGCGLHWPDKGGKRAISVTPQGYKLVSPGTLTVGSDTKSPPFESMKGRTAEGFDVDLMNAIGRLVGLKVVFQTEKPNTIWTRLSTHEFDVVASAASSSPGRAKIVNFSEPYFDASQSVAILAISGITTESALYDKRIGVMPGSAGMEWATANLAPKGAQITEFNTRMDLFDALQAGSVAAVVDNLPATVQTIRSGPNRGFAILEDVGTAEQYRIAVAKDNPALLRAINGALGEMKVSGELKKIYDKWIPSSQQ